MRDVRPTEGGRHMKTLTTALVLLASVGVTVGEDSLDARFGAEGEKRIVELTLWLEEHPLAENHAEVFTEVFIWWVEAPHLTLNWCASLLIEGKNKKASTLVVKQGTIGAGAYLIQNRDGSDALAISMAGVESALRAYERAAQAKKKYRDKFYDELLQRWKSGDLEEYVAEKLKECEEAEAGQSNNRLNLTVRPVTALA